MDSRKCKLKFAFIDILLCILAILFLIFLLARPKGESVTGEYTLLLTLPSEYAEAFESGAPLLDAVGKGDCGTVYKAESAEAFVETAYGIFPKEGHSRLFITVRGEARKKQEALCFGTLTPLPGKSVYLHLPCVCEGICLSVSELSSKSDEKIGEAL